MLLDFLLPAPCVVCGQLPKPICKKCQPVGFHGQDTIQGVKLYFAFRLSGDIEAVLKSYKDKSRIALERALAVEFDKLLQRVAKLESFNCYATPPINFSNFKRRGFTPIERLVRRTSLAQVKKIGLASNRKIADQRSLSKPARFSNTSLAFGAKSGNGRVLLVDDVATSGATLREMRRSLEAAGYEVVAYCVLARRFGL